MYVMWVTNMSGTCWSEWVPGVRRCSSTPHTGVGIYWSPSQCQNHREAWPAFPRPARLPLPMWTQTNALTQKAGTQNCQSFFINDPPPPTCGDLAPLLVCLGSVSSTPSNSWLVSWLSLVILALLWRPKTSGSALMGRLRM